MAKKILKQCVGIRNTTRKQKLSKYETYYAQPTFLSSKKYFYHSTTTARAEFDFTRDEKHRIKVDQVADFYIGMGADYEAVLQELTKIVGRQLYWNWQWDKELYPNLPDKIKELASRGIKVLGFCNPFLATEKELYQIASKKGYCVKEKDGNDYMVKITTFPAAMVDFTNPEAYDWIKGIIKENLIGLGLAGWMADFGEYLLGRDMLVAPVVRPGETKRKVYLPQDKWIHLWSGKVYDGGTYTVDAPIGEIPVFVRKEAFEQF